jgi:hypothetical protein
VGSLPATTFAATGYVTWGSAGTLHSAAASAKGSFALWDGPEGMRLFHDAQGGAWLGLSDADAQAHAALMRWSPDGRYLLWGYPRVALAGTDGTATPLAGALCAAVPALTTWTQSQAAQGDLTLWLSPDHSRLIIATSMGSATAWTVRARDSGATLATLTPLTTNAVSRATLDWRHDGTAFARAGSAVEVFITP